MSGKPVQISAVARGGPLLLAVAAAMGSLVACGGSHGKQAAATVTVTRSPSSSTSAPVMTAPNAVPSGKPGAPRGGVVAGVNTADPSAVAVAAAQTTYRWDTRIDQAPIDAERRASTWLAPQLVAQLQPATAGAGAAWNTLAAHQGWSSTTAVVDSAPRPPDTATTADRQVNVTQTFHGSGGWTAPAQTHAVLEQLTRAGGSGPWRVSVLKVLS